MYLNFFPLFFRLSLLCIGFFFGNRANAYAQETHREESSYKEQWKKIVKETDDNRKEMLKELYAIPPLEKFDEYLKKYIDYLTEIRMKLTQEFMECLFNEYSFFWEKACEESPKHRCLEQIKSDGEEYFDKMYDFIYGLSVKQTKEIVQNMEKKMVEIKASFLKEISDVRGVSKAKEVAKEKFKKANGFFVANIEKLIEENREAAIEMHALATKNYRWLFWYKWFLWASNLGKNGH